MIVEGTSDLRGFRTRLASSGDPPDQVPPPTDYIEALRKILRANPSGGDRAMKPHLEEEREVIRAIAACALFEGTNRAKDYAPEMIRVVDFAKP